MTDTVILEKLLLAAKEDIPSSCSTCIHSNRHANDCKGYNPEWKKGYTVSCADYKWRGNIIIMEGKKTNEHSEN